MSDRATSREGTPADEAQAAGFEWASVAEDDATVEDGASTGLSRRGFIALASLAGAAVVGWFQLTDDDEEEPDEAVQFGYGGEPIETSTTDETTPEEDDPDEDDDPDEEDTPSEDEDEDDPPDDEDEDDPGWGGFPPPPDDEDGDEDDEDDDDDDHEPDPSCGLGKQGYGECGYGGFLI